MLEINLSAVLPAFRQRTVEFLFHDQQDQSKEGSVDKCQEGGSYPGTDLSRIGQASQHEQKTQHAEEETSKKQDLDAKRKSIFRSSR